jgi:hypothetical protein
MAQQPLVGHDLLITEASQLHSDTPRTVGFLWRSDQPNAEASDNKQHSQETDIRAPVGFESAIPPSDRPQTDIGRICTDDYSK